MKNYYVYILANERPTLYVGMTSDLVKRIHQHKAGYADGFSKKYGLKKLVYYEVTNSVESAIRREKQLKWWRRDWKIELIRKDNPGFDDLYERILGSSPRMTKEK